MPRAGLAAPGRLIVDLMQTLASASPTHAAPRLKVARLLALTEEARNAIQTELLVIDHFPFKVGRECRTLLTRLSMSIDRRMGTAPPLNDLYIDEKDQVVHLSREHFLIDATENGFFLVDRGSVCGTLVSGKRVGGDRTGGRVALRDHDIIIVGSEASPYVFKFRMG